MASIDDKLANVAALRAVYNKILPAASTSEVLDYLALPGVYPGDISDIEIASLSEVKAFLGISS